MLVISKDAEVAVTELRGKLWNNMTGHEAAIQFADLLVKLWRVHSFRDDDVIIRTSQLRQTKIKACTDLS